MSETPAKARDYSETLFLPKTDFPMRAGLPQKEPAILERWQQHRPLRAAARRRQGPAALHPPRRAALRQWQHPYRARARQDPQGRGDAKPADARLRFQLRAGLGLPRPADRMEDRGGEYRAKGKPKPDLSDAAALSSSASECRAIRRSTGSTCSARNSAARRRRRLGRTPTPRWTFPPRRRSRAS